MTTFIADHKGILVSQSNFVRPVHIGSALCEKKVLGPEPDNLFTNNISRCEAYADLRLYDHIYKQYRGNCEILAILQYRRMYYLGYPEFYNARSQLIRLKMNLTTGAEKTIRSEFRPIYLSHLLTQSDDCLWRELLGNDFVVNRKCFRNHSVQEQYLSAVKTLYPSQTEYVDAWHDMRIVLEREISPSLVSECFDGNICYINNCLITDWNNFEKYYLFLFHIINELSVYKKVFRLFGYLSERILGLFLLFSNKTFKSKSMMVFDH